MRDIFLQPFNDQLLGCVAATYLILLLAMATVLYAAKTILHDEEERHVGIGEAALWCISIMCMQGSSSFLSYADYNGTYCGPSTSSLAFALLLANTMINIETVNLRVLLS